MLTMMNAYVDDADSNEYYQSENDLSGSMAPNNISDSSIEFDIDSMFENIHMIQDDEISLDEITFQLLSKCENKVETLTKIQQHSVSLKCAIGSSKYHVTELHELQNQEQQKCEGEQREIGAKRLGLEELKSQKVNDLANLENDINKKSEDFIMAPKEYDSKTLNQAVNQLEKEVSEKITELNQYKEDMIHDKERFKEISSDDNNLAPIHKMFDESVTDINSLDNKLKLEVEQLTSELNMARVKFNLFTKLNYNP